MVYQSEAEQHFRTDEVNDFGRSGILDELARRKDRIRSPKTQIPCCLPPEDDIGLRADIARSAVLR
jgi:hypothetical protein